MSNIQTSSFVKKLAANDRVTRENALNSLQKFLQRKEPLPSLEYQKLWKGLFYAMWLCDKPRPQHRLAEDLGRLYLDCIPLNNIKPFFEAFWIIIDREWTSLDRWRIDKFYSLIRKVVHYNLARLQKEDWNQTAVENFVKVMEDHPLSGRKDVPNAIPYHVVDLFIDELEKVLFPEAEEEDSELPEQVPMDALLEPFKKLSKDALLKTLRVKVREDLLADPRLSGWGVISDEEEQSDEEEEEAEEWHGF